MREGLRRLRVLSGTAVFVLSLLTVLPTISVGAANEVFSGGSDVSGLINSDIAIDDLHINGTGDDELTVKLYVAEGDMFMDVEDGISFAGDSYGNNLQFSGTRSDLNTALASLHYTHNRLGTYVIEATIVSESQVFNPANDHLYEVVYASEGIDWNDAFTAANNLTAYGADGYLVTITSPEENAFVSGRLSDDGWMGASDADEEGVWKWVNGPELGEIFWTEEGGAFEGAFVNWGFSQPDNNGEGGEQCGQVRVGEENDWNDLPCDYELDYYIVEYGADDDEPTVPFADIEVTVIGATIEVDSCEELQELDEDSDAMYATVLLTEDIDCTGIDFEPLFPGQFFAGTFDGQGHTIFNLSINQPDASQAGLFGIVEEGAVLRNVTFSGGGVEGSDTSGALAGRAYGVSIENVHSDLDVSGTWEAGGLLGHYSMYGYTDGVFFRNNSSSGNISGFDNAGGLIGRVELEDGGNVLIEKVFATGDVSVEEGRGGGLFGLVEAYSEVEDTDTNLIIQDVYAQGDVVAGERAGGLIGDLEIDNDDDTEPVSIILRRAYASGNVTGVIMAGGLIGQFETPDGEDQAATIADVFAAGQVTATDVEGLAGGIAGWLTYLDGGTLTDSNVFYDRERTGQSYCFNAEDELLGFSDCQEVNGENSQPNYFFNNTTNAPLNHWDFEDVWVMHANTYPTFGDIEESPDANGDDIPDDQQANISSYANPVTGKLVVIDVGEDCTITTDDTVRESNFDVQDPGYDYENGLFDFAADCGDPGFTTTIKLYYYGISVNGLVVRKHNPHTGAYFNLTGTYGATLEQMTINGQSVAVATYQITDGGVLDMDGAVDGQLTDPVGLATNVAGTPNTGAPSVRAFLFR